MNQPTTTAVSAANRLALGRCTLDMAAGELLDARRGYMLVPDEPSPVPFDSLKEFCTSGTGGTPHIARAPT